MPSLAKHIRGSLYLVRRDPHVAVVDLSRFSNSTGIDRSSGAALEPDQIGDLVSECKEVKESLSEDDHAVLKDILLVDPRAARSLKALGVGGLIDIFSDIFKGAKQKRGQRRDDAKKARDWLKGHGDRMKDLERSLEKSKKLSELLEHSLQDGAVTGPDTLELLDQFLKEHPESADILTEEDLKKLNQAEPEKDPDPTPILLSLERFAQVFNIDLKDKEIADKLAWTKPDRFRQTLKDLKVFLPSGIEEVGISSAETGKDTKKNLRDRIVHFLFRDFDEQWKFIKKYKLIKGEGEDNYLYSTKPVIRRPADTSPSKEG